METLLQTLIYAVTGGIFAQIVAEKVKLPSIVFLMIFGVLLGPQVLNLVQPESLGEGLEILVKLAVALILFEGGLSLDLQSFKEVNQSVRNMVTLGVLIMIAGSAITIHYLLDFKWTISFLFGAFMSITGLTVINPILQRVRVKRDVATILKSEGILTNAIGAIAAIAILEIILAPGHSVLSFSMHIAKQLFLGSLVGFSMGWLLGKAIKIKFISSDLKNLVTLAWVFGTFYLANQIENNIGIMAVVMLGYAVQRENIPQINTLKKFKGQLSILLISILFILISANLKFENLMNSGVNGLWVIFIVVFVVRPIMVFVSNAGLISLKDKIFISWIGPKGIVSASVASLFAIILSKNGFEEGVLLESLVFLTIIATVLAQGLSANWAAKLTDTLLQTGGVVVIGANTLGRTLGTAFHEIGKEVVLIDNNFDHCKESSNDGLETVYGNCLDPAIQEIARMENASTVIATTSNSEVNFLACQMIKDNYAVQHVYPAIDSPDKGVHHKLVDEIGGNLAYAKTVSIEDWKNAINHSEVQIVEWVLNHNKSCMLCELESPTEDPEAWLPLILKREDEYFFAHSDQMCSAGDVLIYLQKS